MLSYGTDLFPDVTNQIVTANTAGVEMVRNILQLQEEWNDRNNY